MREGAEKSTRFALTDIKKKELVAAHKKQCHSKAMPYNLFKKTLILYFVLVMLGAVFIAAVGLMRERIS